MTRSSRPITYRVISACEKGQMPQRALHQVSRITYRVISACEKGQMPQQALHRLQELLLQAFGK